MEYEFKKLMRKWKHDSVVKNLNRARNALYRVGFEIHATDITRELRKRLDFLEQNAEKN